MAQFSRTIALLQQIADVASRAVHLQAIDPTADMAVPLLADRVGRIAAFDAVDGSLTVTENFLSTLDEVVSGALAANSGLNHVTIVNDFAALLVVPPYVGAIVHMRGYATAGDGGEGPFRWDPASTAAHDGGVIVQPTGGGVGRWVRQSMNGVFNVQWWGASAAKTKAENKAILQVAIAVCDSFGGGKVIVPWPINYGYNIRQKSTQPDFSACANDLIVHDYGVGDSYTIYGFKEGSQDRIFYGTKQVGSYGQHDGNGFKIMGDWHPYLWIDNDKVYAPVGDPSRSVKDNRRASVIFAVKGLRVWQFYQGAHKEDILTDNEMKNISLTSFQSDGDSERHCVFLSNWETTNTVYGRLTTGPLAAHHFNQAPESTATGVPSAMVENLEATVTFVLKSGPNLATFTYAGTIVALDRPISAPYFKGTPYSSGGRPSASAAGVGAMIFDNTLGIPLWSVGGAWADATGAPR